MLAFFFFNIWKYRGCFVLWDGSLGLGGNADMIPQRTYAWAGVLEVQQRKFELSKKASSWGGI